MITWLRDWLTRHAQVFRLSVDEACLLVGPSLAWGASYASAELHDATDNLQRMHGHDHATRSAKWHIDAIPQAISDQRALAERARAANQPARNSDLDCRYCGGTGWAIVPHPGKWPSGQWKGVLVCEPAFINRLGQPVFRDLAVICTCPDGGKLETAHAKHERKTINLLQYDTQYRNWREVADRIAEIREVVATGEESEPAKDLKKFLRTTIRNPHPAPQGAKT